MSKPSKPSYTTEPCLVNPTAKELGISVSVKPMGKCNLPWYKTVDWGSVLAFTAMFLFVGYEIYRRGQGGAGGGDQGSDDDFGNDSADVSG